MKRLKRLVCRLTEHKPWYFGGDTYHGWLCLRCEHREVRLNEPLPGLPTFDIQYLEGGNR